jgi:hypothetical protein
MQSRRAIVTARIRVVFLGHAAFFAICLLLEAFGRLPAGFLSAGCWSLFFLGVVLILAEWLHVKMQPRVPPRFVVRSSGLTEYGQDGPRAHWDWHRTHQLSIESDRERPGYRSLVLAMQGEQALLRTLHRFYIPLPDEPEDSPMQGEVNEREVVAALWRAFEQSRIAWVGRNGAVALMHQAQGTIFESCHGTVRK